MGRNFYNSMGRKFFNEKQIVDGKFVKKVKTSKHFFNKYSAWGMAIDTLEELKERGIEQIEIQDTEERIVYQTTVDRFLTKGVYGNFGNAGAQRFLQVSPTNYTQMPLGG